MVLSNKAGFSGVTTFVDFNGTLTPSQKAILTAENRSFRYGDGLFETIRVSNGQILLKEYHFERLLKGVKLLQFNPLPGFTREMLADRILELCRKNGHIAGARVRLVVYRGDGGLYELENNIPHYLIQSWELPAEKKQQEAEGWKITVFSEGRKACDVFSHLKSNNFLLYALAAIYAQKEQANDSLVLNSHGRIADTTIANLFYIKNGRIITPPLSEGCVAGVMRRFLAESIQKEGIYPLEEKEVTIGDLEGADEVFLTNAIRGIIRVSSFGEVKYTRELTDALCRRFTPDY
ncbi:aminotransferase class IV [Flavitalea flava]